MNSTTNENESFSDIVQPGAYLASEREKRGVSLEQIATKLNLRVQVLSYLEADQYDLLPQPVFVQGYIRAYCKYLGIAPETAIEAYLTVKPQEQRSDKYLWQNQEHPNKNERWLYWMTLAFIIVSVISVSMWVYENKANPIAAAAGFKPRLAQKQQQPNVAQTNEIAKVNDFVQPSMQEEEKVGDVNKVQNLLSNIKQENFSPKDME